ncbi:putative MFS family arabinose efflux permease [Motilibacter peucedani]|uniref:Putative MFS family arabinose efflux permease n=1 Tax=Motilibacter peucedani TaxID=598650 RepID=A0A420XL84_9ACTN|nr:MFS transporter [Motilibacter peucedani]RKS71294.1 putative MFS family arabinose efflux permease [Motilibacter peucedani]
MEHETAQLLRLPGFRRLLGARVLAALANAAAPVLLAFAVLDIRHSAYALGVVLAARSVPQVLLVLAGGVVADRVSRHRVAVAALAVATLTQAGVAALVLTGTVEVWQLAALEAVNGAATAFLMPATEALTGTSVDERLVHRAVPLVRLGVTTASVGGAAFGGLLLATTGTGWGFALDAAAFGAAAVLMARARGRSVEPGREPRRTRPLDDLVDGFREFRRRRWLLVVVAQFFVINAVLAGAWSTLGPVIAERHLGRTGWGFVSSSLAVGMVLGGLLMLKVRVTRLLAVGVAATLLVAPSLLVLGAAPSLPALVVAVVVGGAAIETFEIAWQTSLTQNVPEGSLSRVMAFEQFGTFAAIPVGQVLAGPVASALGTRSAVVCGGLLVVATSLWALSSRSVRSLERRGDGPHLPAQAHEQTDVTAKEGHAGIRPR